MRHRICSFSLLPACPPQLPAPHRSCSPELRRRGLAQGSPTGGQGPAPCISPHPWGGQTSLLQIPRWRVGPRLDATPGDSGSHPRTEVGVPPPCGMGLQTCCNKSWKEKRLISYTSEFWDCCLGSSSSLTSYPADFGFAKPPHHMSQFLKKQRSSDRQILEWTKENGSLERGEEGVSELGECIMSTQDRKGEARRPWQ